MSATGVEALNDEQLLNRMMRHRADAWREFHRRYDRLIWGCITHVLGRFAATKNRADIEEVYAIFLVSLTDRDMHKLRAFDPARKIKLGTWIHRLASNAAW